MKIVTKSLGYRELRRLCNSVLRIIENPIFHEIVYNSDHQVKIGYDLKYDKTYIEAEHQTYYEEDLVL